MGVGAGMEIDRLGLWDFEGLVCAALGGGGNEVVIMLSLFDGGGGG